MRFVSEQQVVDYVEAEVAQVIPDGWSCLRLPGPELRWELTNDSSVFPAQDYQLCLTKAWDMVVLEHSNSDAGAFCVARAMRNAKVVDCDDLDVFPLSALLQELLASCKPNVSGLS